MKDTALKTYVRWENNIKVDLTDSGQEDAEWIDVAQDTNKWWAVVNMLMDIQVLENAVILLIEEPYFSQEIFSCMELATI